MRPGTLVKSDVMAFTSRVLVDGVERPHVAWSLDRELVGDMPAQVAGGAGVSQATGAITWESAKDVSEGARNPWNTSLGRLPSRGQSVQIFTSDGNTEWQQFTGIIDETRGSAGKGFSSTIVDRVDKLSEPFTHSALLRLMPPVLRGADAYRAVGLTHLYFVDRAMRTAGFYALPPMEARQALSVPAQSSMWPEAGTMSAGVTGGVDGGPWCNTYDGPHGVAVSNVLNTYTTQIVFTMADLQRHSMTVSPDHSGNTSMKTYFGATDYIELAVAGSRTAVARLNGTTVCSLSMGAGTRVSLVVEGSAWELRTDAGATATGTATATTTAAVTRVSIAANSSSRVAGFHLCRPSESTRWEYTTKPLTARYRMDRTDLLGLMDASHAIELRTCMDVLDEISKATCSAMWIDEQGVMTWAPSVSLRNQASMQTVTTLDDITSLDWSDSVLSVRSRVDGVYELPVITLSRWDNVLWHQGSSASMEAGQVKSELLTPPSGTEWVQEANDFLVLGQPGSALASNRGQGSLTGAVVADADSEAIATSSQLSASLTRVTVDTWKLVHSVGSIPAGKTLELRYPEESTTIWPKWLNESFPLIRGFAKFDVVDQTLSAARRGPDYAPVLTHRTGLWLSREDDTTVLLRLLENIAAQVSEPSPLITGLNVTYDPRRQLGDVITISSPTFMGVTLRCLVVGKTDSAGASFEQSLTVRVISASTTFQSYDEWNTQNPGTITHAQWAALPAMTYNQFRTSED